MSDTGCGPAYRIETKRLVIRCWDPQDARLLKSAVDISRQHLAQWMPWAREEPLSLDDQIQWLRKSRADFDLDRDYIFGIFNLAEDIVLGGTGLHTRRGKERREIGYWIHKDHLKQGLATEATTALIKVAFEIDAVGVVEIRCDPNNLASSAIPKKLGFSKKGVMREDLEYPGANRDTEIWILRAQDYPQTPAYNMKMRAFDACKRSIPLTPMG